MTGGNDAAETTAEGDGGWTFVSLDPSRDVVAAEVVAGGEGCRISLLSVADSHLAELVEVMKDDPTCAWNKSLKQNSHNHRGYS